MKRLILILFMLVLSAPAVLTAQSGEPVADKKAVEADIGKILYLGGGFGYFPMAAPVLKVGASMDFQLNNMIVVNLGGSVFRSFIPSGTEFDAEAAEGELTSVQLSILFKFFFMDNLYAGAGLGYRFLVDGYYVDDSDAYATVSKFDVKPDFPFIVAGGFKSEIIENIVLDTGLRVEINLPTATPFSFEMSDILVGLDIGLGFKFR